MPEVQSLFMQQRPKKGYHSKDLWKALKKEIREIEDDSGVLFFDDTVQEKAHTQENDLICWHYDHTINRSVKGISLLTCRQNQLKWRYVLVGSWFSSSENMKFIHEKLKKHFILALKNNRLVALSLADKQQGRYVRIVIHWFGQKSLYKDGLKVWSFQCFYIVNALQTKMKVREPCI